MEELEAIRSALAAGITKAELARRAEVAPRLLVDIDKDDFNPTLRTLRRLADAAKQLTEEKLAALGGSNG